jgi:hypothetical protein
VAVEGAYAVLRRRGAAEAGAVYVLVDRLDGRVAIFAPGPTNDALYGERRWLRAHEADWIEPAVAEARLARELRNDPDLWLVEVESRDGRHWLDVVPS